MIEDKMAPSELAAYVRPLLPYVAAAAAGALSALTLRRCYSSRYDTSLSARKPERTGHHMQRNAGPNVYCTSCDMWLRDDAQYTVHIAGKKHRMALLSVSGNSVSRRGKREKEGGSGTLSHEFFSSVQATSAPPPIGVITVDLEKPENAGAICRPI